MKTPELPKYFLAGFPHDLHARVLDRCFRRLWHEAMELLERHGFNDYTQDDLVNFYHWAPTTLPSVEQDSAVARVPLAPASAASGSAPTLTTDTNPTIH